MSDAISILANDSFREFHAQFDQLLQSPPKHLPVPKHIRFEVVFNQLWESYYQPVHQRQVVISGPTPRGFPPAFPHAVRDFLQLVGDYNISHSVHRSLSYSLFVAVVVSGGNKAALREPRPGRVGSQIS
jgi:hypothetical protein